jgi:hypothetical protein
MPYPLGRQPRAILPDKHAPHYGLKRYYAIKTCGIQRRHESSHLLGVRQIAESAVLSLDALIPCSVRHNALSTAKHKSSNPASLVMLAWPCTETGKPRMVSVSGCGNVNRCLSAFSAYCQPVAGIDYWGYGEAVTICNQSA